MTGIFTFSATLTFKTYVHCEGHGGLSNRYLTSAKATAKPSEHDKCLSICESVPSIDQRLGPIHQRRLGAIHQNTMPSTSDVMPFISESVTHCQSRRITKQSFHGLNATLCPRRAGKGRARPALVADVKYRKCSILGTDHDNIILLPRLPFLFLYSDNWYFYNVSFMLEIIVLNCRQYCITTTHNIIY